MMWCAVLLVFLAVAANAEQFQAWKLDTEYLYVVEGRTLAALNDVEDRYTGIVLKAMLTIRPKSMDTLQAKVSTAQYARIHTILPEGWKSEIPDSMLDYKPLPMSEGIFEIVMKYGTIRDIIIDKDVPTWEVNMLKSIISQLQVDTQGENLIPSKYNQIPEGDDISATYKVMEDSVGGQCEVLYDISPLPAYSIQQRFHWFLNPKLVGDEKAIDIVKTKNYTNCKQRMSYHFGFTGTTDWDPSTNENSEFMSRSSISRIIITGDLKSFTIQSSIATDKVVLSPNFYESQKGMVGSRVNVTLLRMGVPSLEPWMTPMNAASTGNLVYSYNNPFPGPGEGRRPGKSYSNDGSSNERFHYTEEMDATDPSSSKRTRDNLDSLENIEQGTFYWQVLPTLNEAPSMPLLPFFIGDRGKSIGKSDAVNVVATVKSLASQIGSDLQNPSNITEENTLEKFTTLARLIRTMSTEQIAEVQREVYQVPNEVRVQDEGQSVRRNTWIAYRDALAQAGTGPALITIKNLIKEKKIIGMEAASVVGTLSKTARTPTSEYMDVFFQMATMPETAEQEYLNTSAIVSFAELIRYSVVNHASAHNRYPVHSFGPLSPKNNPAIPTDYISYMSEQLTSAINSKEYAKSHAFIWALGATAHPKILNVYEPYLEGTNNASTFQRLLMVISLNNLAMLNPRLARGVLYRIYQNTAEAYQLRCAAVKLIMSTNPPASMLQRMAEFTHYDVSKQVNAAVVSAIETAGELEAPEFQDLATKARNVWSLLKKENYGFEYSKNWLFHYVAEEMNIASRADLSQIGSEDNFIPQAIIASVRTMYGDFNIPPTEMGAMVSSVKDLYNAFRRQWWSPKDSKDKRANKSDFTPEKIAKILHLETNWKETFEGALWLTNPYANKFFSFDEQSLSRIPALVQTAMVNIEKGQDFNVARMQCNDVTLSFPLESGLPFLYSFKIPSLLKISGSMKGNKNLETMEGSLDVGLLYAVQLQSKLGLIVPWENQQYMAGINQDHQGYLPIRASVTCDKSQKQASLKLEPLNKNEKYTLMESRIVPYTAGYSILNMAPVLKDAETHVLTKGEVWMKGSEHTPSAQGFNFKIESEFDTYSSTSPHEDVWHNNPLVRFGLGLGRDTIDYYRTRVYLMPNPLSSQSIILSASYEALLDDSTTRTEKKNETFKDKSLRPISSKLNDPERKKQLLEEAAWGIMGAEAFAVDIGMDLPGKAPLEAMMTISYANSKVDEKSQGLMYMRVNSGEGSGEICVSLESESPKASVFDMEVAGKSQTKSTWFNIDLRSGVTCKSTPSIQIIGNQSQSESYRKAIEELPSAHECLKATMEGRLASAACQEFNARMSTMDETEISFMFDKDVVGPKKELSGLIEMAEKFDSAIVYHKRQSSQASNDNTLELSMTLDPFDNSGTFVYRSPDTQMYIPAINVGPFGNWLSNVDPDLSTAERMNIKLNDMYSSQRTCIIDKNSATTFDQATYPLTLGKCWHVVLTTNPIDMEMPPWSWKQSDDAGLSVLARDSDNNKKEFILTLGNAELRLEPSNGGIVAAIDGTQINLNDTLIYRHKDGENIELEVLLRPDDSIQVLSSKYGIDVIYNGQDLRIKASGYYRSDLRGLCGNYNGNPEDDFINPKQCFATNFEEFAASYVIITDECKGQIKELSNQLDEKKVDCRRKVLRPTNVVTDSEAGRRIHHSLGSSNWGYHSKKYNRA